MAVVAKCYPREEDSKNNSLARCVHIGKRNFSSGCFREGKWKQEDTF
jgi:hypothetical protein